jgi:hypothetical protein
MSRYAENLIWQNADKTWGIGFYKRISRNVSGENESYDSEWDDDYDYEHFAHAANGFPSADAAQRWWTGANPGSFQIAAKKLTVKETKEFADMVRAANNPAFSKELDAQRAKTASLTFIKNVRDKLRANEPVAYKTYRIRFSLSTLPAATGMVEDHSVILTPEGDWLGFEKSTRLKNGSIRKSFVKVWNTKTRTQTKNIIWLEEVKKNYGYRF